MPAQTMAHSGAKRLIFNDECRNHTDQGDDENDSVDSTESIQGLWEGELATWNGCSCGNLHRRPTKVFWIQCEGSCQSWYNVSSNCVGFTELQAETISPWYCHACREKLDQGTLAILLGLPSHVLYHVLDYAARKEDKTRVLIQQLSVLCSQANHAIKEKPGDGLWSLILNRDYHATTTTTSSGERRVSPKRRRRTALDLVKDLHCLRRSRTEDAHAALLVMADSRREPLTLARLRMLIGNGQSRPDPLTTLDSPKSHGSNQESNQQRIFINQRSQFGRTFLHAVCSASVNEAVLARCVRHLLREHGADPTLITTAEHPYADRPALFFAVSRVMPKVVQELVDAGASLKVQVSGRFRLVSDPSRGFDGTFTALEFAAKLKHAEEENASLSPSCEKLPAYWMRKLGACITILSKAAIV
mmetsp:Transcript_2790/g.7815  ORF Transcript_2790/g.7815 Transcript_2790/m.7815 type:complete len:417 (+) Transcript_2790:128-1378(+)